MTYHPYRRLQVEDLLKTGLLQKYYFWIYAELMHQNVRPIFVPDFAIVKSKTTKI